MSKKIDYDYAKFESIMEKEISHRKMLGNISSAQSFSELGIMDQFFIIGIPPSKDKNPVPTIMAAFPPFRQSGIPVENVLSLSMQHWDFTNPSTKSKSPSIFTSSCDNGIVDEFVFQFNAGETKMYGVCSHILPSKAIKSSKLPFFATDSTKKNIFCMCLITKLPIFNAHFTFLNYLASLASNTLLQQPTNTDINNSFESTFFNKYENDYRIDHDIQNDTIIEGLEITGTFGQILGITIPEEFQSKVFDYYSKTMYSSSFKLAPGFNIRFPPPTTPEQRLISWSSLDTLFSVLSVRDIIELLGALILDAQVLIVGSSMQEVSMTVYGLYALLSPFKYCGVVMPIIPNNDHYLELLSSPTPFIFGMPNIQKLKKMSFLESTYIVNVDKHKMPPVNYFPKYPSYAKVVRNVAEIVASKDNTAFRPEDELLEINKGLKERSRSAIIALNSIPGSKQIRIKPNFSPSNRRNYNTIARINFNLNLQENATNKVDSGKKVVEATKNESSEKVENADSLENHAKMEPLAKVENADSFENHAKMEPLAKVENADSLENNANTEASEKVEIDKPAQQLTRIGPSEKEESVNSSENPLKTETPAKAAIADPFAKFSQANFSTQSAGDLHDKKEGPNGQTGSGQKPEPIVQFPSFKAAQPRPIQRRFTCTHIQFSPQFQASPPSISAASSQPLSEFPVFKKPIVPSEAENDSNPYKFPPDLPKKLCHKVALSKDSIDRIQEALHEPLEHIFTDLLNCYFVTNSLENITIFNQSLFLASVKQEDLQFYEFLLESQTFQDYVETKLNEFSNSKSKETGQRRKSTFGPKTKRRVSTVKKLFES